jgi:hypothetical protein
VARKALRETRYAEGEVGTQRSPLLGGQWEGRGQGGG